MCVRCEVTIRCADKKVVKKREKSANMFYWCLTLDKSNYKSLTSIHSPPDEENVWAVDVAPSYHHDNEAALIYERL